MEIRSFRFVHYFDNFHQYTVCMWLAVLPLNRVLNVFSGNYSNIDCNAAKHIGWLLFCDLTNVFSWSWMKKPKCDFLQEQQAFVCNIETLPHALYQCKYVFISICLRYVYSYFDVWTKWTRTACSLKSTKRAVNYDYLMKYGALALHSTKLTCTLDRML